MTLASTMAEGNRRIEEQRTEAKKLSKWKIMGIRTCVSHDREYSILYVRDRINKKIKHDVKRVIIQNICKWSETCCLDIIRWVCVIYSSDGIW